MIFKKDYNTKCDFCGIKLRKRPCLIIAQKNIYCSQNCKNKHQKETLKGDNNPFRKLMINDFKRFQEIRKKAGKRENIYKGIYMMSGWEVKFAKWLDSMNIKWEYEKEPLNTEKKLYIPDFYLPDFDRYIEIKGRYLEKGMQKFSYWKKKQPNRFYLFDKHILKKLGII